MEELNLSDTETRYFGDLFLYCDEESNERIPMLKATELFRSSDIPNEVIKQIMDITLSPNTISELSHMNKKQFYSSLKLIAAYQNDIPLKPDVVTKPLDLPLPRFTWTLNHSDIIHLNKTKEQHAAKRSAHTFNSSNNYEPIQVSNMSDNEHIASAIAQHNNADGHSTDSEVESETTSQHSDRRNKNGSPWSSGSENSPTPTNSVTEVVASSIWENSETGRGVWPANNTEEHTQLLGTEEESSDRHSSDEDVAATSDGSEWILTQQQKQHYAVKFAQLGPDSRGLLSGYTAKLFFEKSNLPVVDLRKIWQLADITKDGALDLTEFCIAMHLVVARCNGKKLPDELPPTLAPAPAGPPTADLLRLGTGGPENSLRTGRPPSFSPPESGPARRWTKFADSPTSEVSSPGPKPVNFDFKRASVERDPKIVHPVALRASPDGADRRLPPRLPPPPSPPTVPKKEPPPPPPPRPRASHTRSSSLDLDRFRAGPCAPPAPPPRSSPPPRPPPDPLADPFLDSFADYGAFGNRDGVNRSTREGSGRAGRRVGAFSVYHREEGETNDSVQSLKEENAVLVRMCRALQQELQVVRRERHTLQEKLDSMQ